MVSWLTIGNHLAVVSKETIRKFTTSVITVVVDKSELKKNVLKTTVTLVNPETKKTVTIKNVKITQLVNEKPVGKGPNVKTKVSPGERPTVTLKVVVEVPHVGSRTKEVIMPVKNGSEYTTRCEVSEIRQYDESISFLSLRIP